MERLIIEVVKKLLQYINLPVGKGISKDALEGQIASDILYNLIISGKPCFVARFGWTEIDAVIAYTRDIEKNVKYGKLIKYMISNYVDNQNLLKTMSGFFSNDIENINKFCQSQIDIMPEIDIHANWMKQELFIEKYLQNSIKISVDSLFDPTIKDSWTQALVNKKVLIINPFEKSIIYQYNNRELLFENKKFLPKFDLIIYKPIQVLNNKETNFETWWQALDFMKNEIDLIDFDIALLSCGAFGHPLCAHIKKTGKQAIYMGSNLQLMFGIYGDRWLKEKTIENNINEYWIRPFKEDLPKNNNSNSYTALKNYI